MNRPVDLVVSIADSVHGTIKLTAEEESVIDHPLFRRLHHIRQNGLLYLIFPSASHSRFSHSLGALHLAQLILDNISFNCEVALEKSTPSIKTSFDNADLSEAFDFNCNEIQDDWHLIYRIVRLSTLVHDLGHGPLSHTFDSFAPLQERIKELLNSGDDENSETDYIKITKEKLQLFLEELPNEQQQQEIYSDNDASDETISHEFMSCLLFTKIWEDLNIDSEINTPLYVSASILDKPNWINKGHDRYIPFIHDIVSSVPVDADRMDYLERDSKNIGVSYGFYDRDRVMKSFLPYKTKIDGTDSVRLGIKHSGLQAVENFIQARYELFSQVYYHKTNQAVQLMLEEIAEEARGIDVFGWQNKDLKKIFELYESLIDPYFLRILRGEVGHWSNNLTSKIERIAENISRRKLWKRIFENKKPGMVNLIQSRLTEEIQKNDIEIHTSDEDEILKYDDSDPEATKGLENGLNLLNRSERHIYSSIHQRSDWTAASSIIGALSEEEQKIARIYLKSDNASDQDNLRKRAREIVSKG